jgi:uncharacterized RDD family membrane protein YckC
MTFTNKFLLNLLIAALLGIAAALCQEYVYYALAIKDIGDYFHRDTTIVSAIVFLALPLFAVWADKVNYAHFYGITAIIAVLFLLLGIHATDSISQTVAQFGFVMASALLMSIAFAKFFYKEDALTQAISLIVYMMAFQWNQWAKFIAFRSSSAPESVPTTPDLATKGWIAIAIIIICSIVVWFLKRQETEGVQRKTETKFAENTTEKPDNAIINGGLLYVLLLGMFLFIGLNTMYGRFSFSGKENAIVSEFMSKNLNLFWFMGTLIAALLSLKIDTYKVLMGLVLTYVLCVFISTFAPEPIGTYAKVGGLLLTGGFFAAKILWVMRTLPYTIVATFLIIETLFYKILNAVLAQILRLEMDESRFVQISLGLLCASAFIAFFFNRDKLYQVRYMEGGGAFDKETHIWSDQTVVPNFATSGQRFTAALLDLFFIWLFSLFISLVSPSSWTTFITLLVQIIYYLSFESHSGSTLGKKIVGITVINHEGQTPSMGHAFQRLLSRFIPLSALTILLGSEALHDRLSDTYVVSANQYYHIIDEETDDIVAEDFAKEDELEETTD